MSRAASSVAQPPNVDLAGLQERMLLEAELMTRESELRNFQVVRDRLAAFGRDANGAYRQILAQRDAVAAKLREVRTPPSEPSKIVLPRRELALVEAPIAAANFRLPIVDGIPGFGYSGFVQAGPLSEGSHVLPAGDITGDISTTRLGSPSYVMFSGLPNVGPDEIPPDQYDPTIRYFWLHNWQVLVPFPPPSAPSHLTYQFNVGVEFEVFGGSIGTLMSFVSVGETANLTGPVAITTDVGWPVIADLSQPTDSYNGSYGSFSGQTTVQRTFAVGADRVPAVAIAVGAVVGLPMQASVQLSFVNDSSIGIYGSTDYQGDYVGGKIAYHVNPEWVLEP
jgi:hypothetical protein